MKRVFIQGSRRISRLSPESQKRLDNIIERGMTVLVGDANGADRIVQQYFARRRYANVRIYCMNGDPRNNVGHWEVVAVKSERAEKDFAFYSQKDSRMCDEADCGFAIWDGKSKGTLNSVVKLVEQGKKALVYLSPRGVFYTVKSLADLKKLLRDCAPEDVVSFDRSIALKKRLNSLDEGIDLLFQAQKSV